MVLIERIKKDWFPMLVHAAALGPLVIMIWDTVQDRYLVDLVREITTRTGKTALILLLLSLVCSPLYLLFRFKWALRVRRPLGLFAFMYAGLHFLTFIWLDYGLDWNLILDAIANQLYVIAGSIALIILTLLAITSTKGWKKRLGKKWKPLHKMVYVAILFASFHFIWLSKDPREAFKYAALAIFLLVFRIPHVRKWTNRIRANFNSLLRTNPTHE
ncbi:MAG: sulfoxide reductase heme-binding subunit YedZ [Anaerolineales bacterium]|nr:sulfoxide reductase heme-binding subunit YedZ [Anaerolineales bacterium]